MATPNVFIKRLTQKKNKGQTRRDRRNAFRQSLPILTETRLKAILSDSLGVSPGDVIFIHSSIDDLNLGFPFYRTLPLLQELVGAKGTLVFPTYPKLPSLKFLSAEELFDINKTPSNTGILTELARREKKAERSLHPTKSVCAIGDQARELTATHQNSVYPYDRCSPYYKIMQHGGKIIGLGMPPKNLSFVHCVEDELKKEFPVEVYHNELFEAKCINSEGNMAVVKTYAHNPWVAKHDVPNFLKKHIPADACQHLNIDGMNFYTADARKLFDETLALAKKDITIYPREVYKAVKKP